MTSIAIEAEQKLNWPSNFTINLISIDFKPRSKSLICMIICEIKLLPFSHFQQTFCNMIVHYSIFWSRYNLNCYGKPTNRSKWLVSPEVVNAFYSAEYNSVTLPEGILQPPLYRPNTIKALNYGGIGQVKVIYIYYGKM